MRKSSHLAVEHGQPSERTRHHDRIAGSQVSSSSGPAPSQNRAGTLGFVAVCRSVEAPSEVLIHRLLDGGANDAAFKHSLCSFPGLLVFAEVRDIGEEHRAREDQKPVDVAVPSDSGIQIATWLACHIG